MEKENKEKTKELKIKKVEPKKKNVMQKKIYVDTPLRIFIIAGLVVIFSILSLIFLKKGLETKTFSSIYYNERSNLDYRVYLKENPYFTEPYLGKGKQYIANLIDYVDVDFNYNFNASDFMDYSYRYLIKADVTVHEKNDATKILYQKSETLIPERTMNYKDSNSFMIRENIKINYSQYNDIVASFKKDYSLALESDLKVTLYIFMNGTYEELEQPLSSTQTMILSMPLTEQTINIGMNYKEVNDSNIVEEYSIVETINKVYFVLFGISVIIALIVTVKLIRFVNKIKVKGTEYDKILSRVLKDYEGIIARVKKVPDFKNHTLVELENFDEILDISEKLDKPILFIEMHKHQKSWFLVVNNNEIYKYALKLVDVDKANFKKEK